MKRTLKNKRIKLISHAIIAIILVFPSAMFGMHDNCSVRAITAVPMTDDVSAALIMAGLQQMTPAAAGAGAASVPGHINNYALKALEKTLNTLPPLPNFQCTHPGCTKSYTFKHDLKTHMDSIHKRIKIKCTQEGCKIELTYKTQRREHSQQHNNYSPEKPNSCHECKLSYKRSQGLTQHVQKYECQNTSALAAGLSSVAEPALRNSKNAGEAEAQEDADASASPLKKRKITTEAFAPVQFGDTEGPAIFMAAAKPLLAAASSPSMQTLASAAGLSSAALPVLRNSESAVDAQEGAAGSDETAEVVSTTAQPATKKRRYIDKYTKITADSHDLFRCNTCPNQIFNSRIKIIRHIEEYHPELVAPSAKAVYGNSKSDNETRTPKRVPSIPCSFKGCTEKFVVNNNMKKHLKFHDSNTGSHHCQKCNLWYPALKSLTRHNSRCHPDAANNVNMPETITAVAATTAH
jgi:hypothetical protein